MCRFPVPTMEPETPAPDLQSELVREVEVGLYRSGYLALRAVDCGDHNGVVYLHGRVPTHYLKQVAQSIAICVTGVRRVVNLIEVVTPGRHATTVRPFE